MNPVLEALQYPFMQQALAIALLLAVTCALLSCYIVHKGWALMGDAISHAVLPGIVIASSLGAPLIVGAFAAGLTCTLATGWLEERSTLKSDTLLGITFATLFAAGFLLYQKSGTDQHLTHILFGNLLGMTAAQLWQVVVICAAVLAILAVKWRDYLLYTFDEAQARLAGMNVPQPARHADADRHRRDAGGWRCSRRRLAHRPRRQRTTRHPPLPPHPGRRRRPVGRGEHQRRSHQLPPERLHRREHRPLPGGRIPAHAGAAVGGAVGVSRFRKPPYPHKLRHHLAIPPAGRIMPPSQERDKTHKPMENTQ